ncbi:zinc ABC transporter substrate-binding protein [Lacrimispora xylanolytica]|uniref:Zinc ABC transporter substrate-binding protein n=2 Tax=Lachnospiraceae TaxID=186803 RepID=A0ABY7AII7_9FIRM|nr:MULTISPECIES: zinc ABC transporter substrate-binding protein [Clostridia]WAJ26033.1 zinc ABC transporter substrate-binding protein [Lacrimispora xylanolytica]
MTVMMITGCQKAEQKKTSDTLNIVATTTMLADLSRVIGGEHVNVDGLMGPGIDPHLYQASAGDVTLMQNADVVVYNGLHLEGKMGEIFQSLTDRGSTVICIEDGLPKDQLLSWEDDSSVHDPHIWFQVSLWKSAAKTVADRLSEADPSHAQAYKKNLEAYTLELEKLDTYIRDRINEIPKDQRVLITAHDAFQYFGKAYGLEVRGLQGISTDAEAGTADVSTLADFITKRKIKAVFVESSVPPKTIEALQAAVKSKGFDVAIGGELYSDSLGGKNSGAETYLLTVKANVDTIVGALK